MKTKMEWFQNECSKLVTKVVSVKVGGLPCEVVPQAVVCPFCRGLVHATVLGERCRCGEEVTEIEYDHATHYPARLEAIQKEYAKMEEK